MFTVEAVPGDPSTRAKLLGGSNPPQGYLAWNGQATAYSPPRAGQTDRNGSEENHRSSEAVEEFAVAARTTGSRNRPGGYGRSQSRQNQCFVYREW